MTTYDATKLFKKVDVLDNGHVELFDAMVVDPRLKIVNAARVSFNKESSEFTEKDEKLVKYLYDHGHFSTYRHSYFSFRIKMPLMVARQWWKYQVGSSWQELDETSTDAIIITDTSWNEMSGRYVEFSPEFYVPESFRKQSKSNKQGSEDVAVETLSNGSSVKDSYIASCTKSYESYQKLIDAGVAKEQARMLLPQSMYTECVWTCSMQTLLHFFAQRLKSDAQYEIREYAKATYQILSPHMMELLGSLNEHMEK